MAIGKVGAGAAAPVPDVSPASSRRAATAGRPNFLTVLQEGAQPRTPDTSGKPPPAVAGANLSARAAEPPNRPAAVVGGLIRDAMSAEKKLDALMTAAARGKTFNANELLALQQLAFRYSQSVEIISRGVDRIVGGVKQTLGTQV